MTRLSLNASLLLAVALACAASLTLGETPLSPSDLGRALSEPGSVPAEIVWTVRAPRAVVAALVGAALGLSGALLQGLLRNPLADPGVLGVSAGAGLGAALAVVGGLSAIAGAVEVAALAGAGLAGAALLAVVARWREPEALILFGVALSSFGGALTSLVFNLSPSPIATAEILAWMLGSVENRGWSDAALIGAALLVAGVIAAPTARGLSMLTLGEETAAASGLPMGRLKVLAVAASALATGTAVAVAGAIGFVGLAAPHLVRAAVRDDPGRLLVPSALAGALILVGADVVARLTPTELELKLGVVTALVGAPLFALIAWRAARSWSR